ncbi:hypothetical protein Agub_g9122 [Astrephomene gubernaculifera]|uniref:Uncharacterized protein n=1 Tax=Astrephomene gubernaculifera TaxID=47775 RepID=A0AAD3HP31_9CHLO|nr:hypothetical protein Agub_g9122 [Astrephomene gubernaculifera]
MDTTIKNACRAPARPFTSYTPCVPIRLLRAPAKCGSSLAFSSALKPSPQSEPAQAPRGICQSMDPRGGGRSAAGFQFNVAYAAIVGVYGLLFLLKNPYIFAVLSILTILPQNSAITSLNSLIIMFYESGLFMNFAEAVYCVRLMTWLSIACTLVSFAIFS